MPYPTRLERPARQVTGRTLVMLAIGVSGALVGRSASSFEQTAGSTTGPALFATGDGTARGNRAFELQASARVVATAAPVPARLLVFGDSYSDIVSTKYPFPKWSQDLRTQGKVGSLQSFAISGSVANDKGYGGGGPKTLKSQIDTWKAGGGTFAARQATVVYMGYNDIGQLADLAPSKQSYKRQVDRLVAAGANAGDRKLLLTMVHDWGQVPAKATDRANMHARTVSWNQTVAAQKAGRTNVITVDLYTAVNRIVANPSAYGLTNVTTIDAAKSKTTALYYDQFHFGRRGQALIAQVYANALTRTTSLANSAATGGAAAQRFHAAVVAQAAGAMPAPTEGSGLALVPLAFGGDDRDFTRRAFAGDDAGTGAGVAVALDEATMLGIVVGGAGGGGNDSAAAWTSRSVAASEGFSTFLRHDMAGLQLQTTVSVTTDATRQNLHDDLIDRGDTASITGSSTMISETASYPVRWHGAVVTPWAELGYRRQSVDGVTVSNPYVADVSYGGTTLDDTMATIGIRGEIEPIEVGEGVQLRLFGGVSYTQGLAQSDYSVSVRDTAFDTAPGRESVQLPGIATAQASIGASMAFGRASLLSLNAAFTSDAGDLVDQTVLLGFSTSF